VQGGISRVIGLIKDHLPDHIRFHHFVTYTQFTGAEETRSADRGSRLVQALVFFRALMQVLVFTLFRRTVFHVHFSNRGSVLRKGLICIVLRLLRCQYVVHAHAADKDLFHPWLPQSIRRMLLWGIGGAGRLIALSQLWYDHYAASLKLPSRRLLLLPNPANLPASIPGRLPRLGVKLLFLGRIGARKGAFDLIRAFAALPDHVRQSCDLTLVGDGDVEAAQKLGAQLGCSSQMTVSGWVGAAKVDQLLAESDIFMLPSHAEGMAMSLVEAMSWGLAVVTSSVGGAGEFLEHRRNSILVDPGDIQGISSAICELACDSALRLRLGLAARETISRFSIDTYIVTLSELYEELATKLPGDRHAGLSSLDPNNETVTYVSSPATDHIDPGQP
jgi:glycosyltransferase involved in cell wall biosynthesis